MTDNPVKMPLGMRLNNPGNLRPARHPASGVEVVDGFAKYNSLPEGVFAYVRLVAVYWEHLHKLTLFDFISTYAPASENDIAAYINAMCKNTHLNPMKAKTESLRLDRAWDALDFMRAQVIVESGRPSPAWRAYPEWISAGLWTQCMREIPMWRDQL